MTEHPKSESMGVYHLDGSPCTLKVPPLTFRERRVGDVVVEELAPLHEHEGEIGAGPVEVGNQSLADCSGRGQGRAGLGYLASGNGHTYNGLVVTRHNCDYRR